MALSVVLKQRSVGLGLPILRLLPRSISAPAVSFRRTAAVLRTTESRRQRRKVPQKQGYSSRYKRIADCSKSPVETAQSHLKLKANNIVRNCGCGDSGWETSLGSTLRSFGQRTEFPTRRYETYVEEVSHS